MMKKMNVLFFGICFFTALIGEIYCIQVLDGDLFTTVGIGLVVLITGFLFIETIQSKMEAAKKNSDFYIDHMLQEENEKWNERYTELLNLQKATYTATKKNTASLNEQFNELLSRLETIENNNSKALQRITELQKKSMEGQKNALKLEINHNRDNSKQIIKSLREEEAKNNYAEQLSKILELLEENKAILSSEDLSKIKNASEPILLQNEEQTPEASMITESIEDNDNRKVTPLYEDPNKNLTADEIAALFASVGK
jgi:hypothetical protein